MKAIPLNESQFQALMADGKPLLVDYWAPWCGYCRRISAAYDKVAQQNEGRVLVAKVNIDEEPQLADQEKIHVIPTLVLYRDGHAVDSIVAPESKTVIDAFLEKALAM